MKKITSINSIEELAIATSISEGYMVTVTLREGTELKHFLLYNKFMPADLLSSHKSCKDLIIDDLEASNKRARDEFTRDTEDVEVVKEEIIDIEEPSITIGEEDAQDTE